jgi:hypothetical protein
MQNWYNEPAVTTDKLTSLSYMSEQFATLRSSFWGTSAPAAPVSGQLYRKDNGDGTYNEYTYNGSTWVQTALNSRLKSSFLEDILTIPGGVRVPIETITSSTPITTSKHTVLINATSGEVVATLPNATTCEGQVYVFKKIDVSANKGRVYSSLSIDLSTYYDLSAQNDAVVIVSDGIKWYAVSKFA